MSEWKSMEPYKKGDKVESKGEFFVCLSCEYTRKFIKILPVTHGPIKKRGKGKVNRDWER